MAHPVLTRQKRFLVLLLLHISPTETGKNAKALYLTFLKFLFLNDPSDLIYLLLHKEIDISGASSLLKELKNFKNMGQCPIVLPFLEQESLVFDRKTYACKKQEEYVDVINFELAVGGKFKLGDIINN